MLRHLLMTAAVAGIALSGPAIAQDQSATGDSAIPLFDVSYSVRNLMGTQVVNPAGEDLGKIYDVLLTNEGAPLSAVISVGGVLGIGDKLIALPFNDIDISAEDRAVVDATAEQLKARRPFDYETATLAELAPLGFGKIAGSEVTTTRTEYLEEWSARMDELATEIEARTGSMAETAETELSKSWEEVEQAWAEVRASTEENWDRTTDAFESAFIAFEQSWEQTGMQTSGEQSGMQSSGEEAGAKPAGEPRLGDQDTGSQ